MTATPPEAKTEYSRASGAFRRLSAGSRRGAPGAPVAAALAGAVVLVAAELTPLYRLHVVTSQVSAGTVSAGSHNSWALIPVAVLAAALAVVPMRAGSRPGMAAVAALGLLALAIALLGDLPDTSAQGVIHGNLLAATTPAIGIYLETLGAVALLAAGGGALLLSGRPQAGAGRDADSPSATGPTRQAGGYI